MPKVLKYFKDYLASRGLRFTRQREAIVQLFLAKKGHLCVDELYYALRKKYKRIGYTTVYRTLKLLKSADIASEINFTGKRKRFEHKLDRSYHGHLVCHKCGRVIEFADPVMEQRQARLCEKYRFKVEKQSLKIFGVCRDCLKKGK